MVKKQLGKFREYGGLGPDVELQVSEMLTDIFNSSLESGQVPEDWRAANVTPLFKKGSREELGKLLTYWFDFSCGEGVGDIN